MQRSPEPLPALTSALARSVLRKLRDVDLRTSGLRVDAGPAIRLEGCLTPDAPVEEGLSYRLVLGDGSDARLDLAWRGGALEVRLDADGHARVRRIELVQAEDGRATAPGIRARMHPDANDRREVERFLRRVVRAAFAADRVA